MILGLDISSETIGWAILNGEDLIDYGFIKPNKKGSIEERLHSSIVEIDEIYNKYKPNIISVEEISKFMEGFSQANTIITLTTFNRVICYHLFVLSGIPPLRFMPATIRSKIRKRYNRKNKLKKDDVCALLKEKFSIKTYTYVPKSGKNRGQIVERKENKDITDAIAVALAAQ